MFSASKVGLETMTDITEESIVFVKSLILVKAHRMIIDQSLPSFYYNPNLIEILS